MLNKSRNRIARRATAKANGGEPVLAGLAVRRRAVWAVLTGVLIGGGLTGRVGAEENTDPAAPLKDAVRRLAETAVRPDKTATIEDRIRRASWFLLVGELAADPERGTLFSSSVDAIDAGFQELNQIEAALAKDPALEGRISRTPALAMRLDAARVRKERVESVQGLSRTQEKERLAQLRELVNAYRELTADLAVANAHLLLGNGESARTSGENAVRKLGVLDQVVGRRRDYYLFRDEPVVDAPTSSEKTFVTSVPRPFADEMLPHVIAQQAVAAYRLAISGATGPDASLLETAITLATRSLEAGPSPNPIALYALASSQRELGLLITSPDPLSREAHDRARDHFQKALANYTQLRPMIEASGATVRGIGPEVVARIGELESPAPFLEAVRRLTLSGRLIDASQESRRGLSHHRSAELALAGLDTARRTNGDLALSINEVRRCISEGLLAQDDGPVQLASAKLALAADWRLITTKLETLNPTERGALSQRVAEQRTNLDSAIERNRDTPRLVSQLRAHSAFATALLAMVVPTADLERDRSAFKVAADASSLLNAQLAENANGWTGIELRESLVTCRLAQGYLAIRVLPSYRDDATNAFAAAADEQAKLPFSGSSLKVFGSPVVTALLSRPDGQATRLAVEERQIRKLVTRFLEGSLARALGNQESAARQMASAIDDLRSANPGEVPPSDAGRTLDQADTSDAKSAVLRSVRSVTVLTFVEAGQNQRALAEALRTVLGDAIETDEAAIVASAATLGERAARSANTALEAYALGMALENVAFASTDQANASTLFRIAWKAQDRAREILEGSPAERTRYPGLLTPNRKALLRLSGPDDDIAQAHVFRKANHPEWAVTLLEGTVKRHPGSTSARAELLRCLVDRADLGIGGDQALRPVLQTILRYRADAKAIDPALELLIAQVQERLGQPAEALASYRAVLSVATTTEQRIQAQSRAAILSLHSNHY